MATNRNNTATWNREDRDLLVELRTNMATIVKQMSSMDITMKEINAGYSSRLLALESNAVNRLEFDQLETRVLTLEEDKIAYRSKIKTWLQMGTLLNILLGIGIAVLTIFYH